MVWSSNLKVDFQNSINSKQQLQNQPWRKAFRNSCNVVVVFEKAIMRLLAALGLTIVPLRPDCQRPGRTVVCQHQSPSGAFKAPKFTLRVLRNVQASWNGWLGKFWVLVPRFDVSCLVFVPRGKDSNIVPSQAGITRSQLSWIPWHCCQEPLEAGTVASS